MKPSLFASSRFFAAVAGATLLVAQTQTFGHTVLGRSSQQAGPNVEEATIAHISCNWAGENHKEYLIYVYPRRNNEARAVQPGTFQIIGNYATEEAAAAAVCTTPIPYNFSGQWVMQVGAESSWCKFRGMLTGGESAYDFLGDADECFDSSGQAVGRPGNVRCHLAQQDQQQWLLNCTATYPAVAPQRPQGTHRHDE